MARVEIKTRANWELGKVELINAEGILIKTKYISTFTFAWQIEQLPAGIYLFKGEGWKEKISKN